jgi:hypothetical protein
MKREIDWKKKTWKHLLTKIRCGLWMLLLMNVIRANPFPEFPVCFSIDPIEGIGCPFSSMPLTLPAVIPKTSLEKTPPT